MKALDNTLTTQNPSLHPIENRCQTRLSITDSNPDKSELFTTLISHNQEHKLTKKLQHHIPQLSKRNPWIWLGFCTSEPTKQECSDTKVYGVSPNFNFTQQNKELQALNSLEYLLVMDMQSPQLNLSPIQKEFENNEQSLQYLLNHNLKLSSLGLTCFHAI